MDTHTSPHQITAPPHEGLIKRSWHAFLSPFSHSALQSLPDTSQRNRGRETRTDRIPEGEGDVIVHTDNANSGNTRLNDGNEGYGGGRDAGANDDGTDGNASALPVSVRVPKKIATPIKVEGKVWFANERTWISYINVGVLIGTLATALFNASEDAIARRFAYFYALISVGVLVYGWVVYQKRITMIRKRDPGHFDEIVGPVVISAFLFIAVLSNFIIRVREVRRGGVPIPGS